MEARHREPFVDFLPGPGDATASFAEEAMRRAAGSPSAADGDRVTTTVSYIESPSVQTAWRLRMAEIGIRLPLAPFYENVQQPDPRAPKGQVDFVLWAYDGTAARPNLGEPDPRAAEAVASIARTRFHLPTWADRAGAVAQQFGAGNEDPRAQLAFEQTKARFKSSLQGIDPDSEEARFTHNIMQGKALTDPAEELRKAQAAQQQLAEGGGGDPDPVVFPGQPVAKLSDYVGMMKKMQTGDMNGALAAYGLNMATYMQVAQAWGAKMGTDPTLVAKFGAMMAG